MRRELIIGALSVLGFLVSKAETPTEGTKTLLQSSDTLSADVHVASWAVGHPKYDDVGLIETPLRWSVSEMYDQSLPSDEYWWKTWDDKVLETLIHKLEDSNPDARAAVRRIAMAEDALKETRAGYMPTVGVSGGYTWERGSGADIKPAVKGQGMSYMSIGLTAQWEVDVFGRISEQLKQSKAQVNLSRADRNAVLVSLCGSLAKAYIQLRGYQAQYALAEAHCGSQQKLVDMTLARQEAGLASALEVTQARQVLYSTKCQLPELKAMIENSISSIAILVGEYPASLESMLEAEASLPDYLPVNPAIATPLEMVRRRPDIAKAEAQLASYAAAVGISKKDFLPSLSISANLGFEAHSFGDWFTEKGFNYNIGPTLSWTIFDGRARSYRVAAAKEQFQVGVEEYNQTLLQAMNEVRTACKNYRGYTEKLQLLSTLVTESQKALNLSVDLYRSSLTPFSNVVDAQVDLLEYETQQIAARVDAFTSLINIYVALGGGY